jgi:glycosyltransferase involved in cell wall biosynthesis
MIYICVPSHNEGSTVGLLLWKIRKVFEEFPREYQFVVGDDGSTDDTEAILQPYQKVLPLTVLRSAHQLGYARTVERLLRLALERTDRPKRDMAILLHADFTHGPEYIPELVRRLESGADMAVTQATLTGAASRSERLVRRYAPLLLRGAVRIPGVRDVTSGFCAFRLSVLRQAFRHPTGTVLATEGWAANAELLARAAAHARQIETVDTVEHLERRLRPSRFEPWSRARELWQAGGALRRTGLGMEARA